MLNFDQHGFLYPHSGQSTDTANFYSQFVANFPTSRTRATLYHEWTKYNQLLRKEVGDSFEQWINGSFVTSKLNPKDIDVVSFIPAHLYERHEGVLDKFWSDTWEDEGVDAYIVRVYPPDDARFISATQIDYQQWARRYSSTKPDMNFVSHPKGFLTMQIS